MKEYWRGVMSGAGVVLVLAALVLAIRFFGERDRRMLEGEGSVWEVEREMQGLREGVINRPVDEFLEDAGVRGAADSAVDEFRRKRDEVLQRFRDRLAD